MAGYATRVKRDIARWVEAGLIDAGTAGALTRDVDAHGGGIRFGTVLSLMAACLFAAAILIFVAANWEEMPRLARVAMLFVVIVVGYVGGAAAKLRGAPALGEGAFIVAAAAFGASIALIGQMYHLSGDERQAVFVWGAGTALAAAALRSGPLTIGAALLAAVWMHMHAVSPTWRIANPPLVFLAAGAVLYALSFWTQSRAARHVLLVALYWFVCLDFGADEAFREPLLLAGLAILLFAFDHVRPAEAQHWLGLDSGLPVQALLGFLVSVGLVQISLVDEPAFLFPSIAAFAGIVAALVLEGRDNGALRWLAYAAFIFQLGFVYVVMLGSMVGTAGFFVVGGLVLSGLAWLIARLERRFSDQQAPAAGGAA